MATGFVPIFFACAAGHQKLRNPSFGMSSRRSPVVRIVVVIRTSEEGAE
jgi:hypothetical protein